MRFQAQRGTNDVLPSGFGEPMFQSHHWARLEVEFREITRLYGYQELRTPVFEDTDLFVRSSGETSDIVTKQMYSFLDKGDRSVTLKPEGTAPAMRAMLEHNLCPPGSVARLSYVTQIFRYERPQKGRYRQAHQFGLELTGSPSPAADAEIIEVTYRFYQRLGLTGLEVMVNSLGRTDCRERYREAILAHSRAYLADQTEENRAKIQRNPLRLLDSKDPAAQEAVKDLPSILEYLEPESQERFDQLQRLLSDAGVPFRITPEIVRGLDYYTETVFEVQSTNLGSQSALCGGGRYDDLIKELGGPPTPSVGVGIGIERMLMVMQAEELLKPELPVQVVIVQATPEMLDPALELARELRASGVSAIMDYDGKSMKSQLRQADKIGARLAIMLGPDELASGSYQIRDLQRGEQSDAQRGDIVVAVGNLL